MRPQASGDLHGEVRAPEGEGRRGDPAGSLGPVPAGAAGVAFPGNQTWAEAQLSEWICLMGAVLACLDSGPRILIT